MQAMNKFRSGLQRTNIHASHQGCSNQAPEWLVAEARFENSC